MGLLPHNRGGFDRTDKNNQEVPWCHVMPCHDVMVSSSEMFAENICYLSQLIADWSGFVSWSAAWYKYCKNISKIFALRIFSWQTRCDLMSLSSYIWSPTQLISFWIFVKIQTKDIAEQSSLKLKWSLASYVKCIVCLNISRWKWELENKHGGLPILKLPFSPTHHQWPHTSSSLLLFVEC